MYATLKAKCLSASLRCERAVICLLVAICILLALTAIADTIGHVFSAFCMVMFVAAFSIRYECFRLPETPQQVDRSISSVINSPTRPRMLYLDNLKVALTLIVVLHHVAICFFGNIGDAYWIMQIGLYKSSFSCFGAWFTFVNQSYFMCLFFFISGHFVPTSYDRKGSQAFLKDRFHRLGLPFLAMVFIGWPTLSFLTFYTLGEAGSYAPLPGPLWFSGWLLLLSFVYAYTEDMEKSRPFYNLRQVFAWAIALSIVQIVCIGASGTFLAFMPVVHGSLPFDLAFFYLGVASKRSGWLEEEEAAGPADAIANVEAELQGPSADLNGEVAMGDKQIAYASLRDEVTVTCVSNKGSLLEFLESYRALNYFLVALFCLASLIGFVTLYETDSNAADGDDHWDDHANVDYTLVYLVFVPINGLMTVFISLSAIDVSKRYLNFQSQWTTYLAEAAYGVYIFHPFFIQLFAVLWIECIIPKQLYFYNFWLFIQSTTDVDDKWLWGGFFFTALLAIPICWIFSALAKSVFFKIL